MVAEYQMPPKILNTQIRVKGMKNICELHHILVPSLPLCGPFYVVIFITPIRVILLLYEVLERVPSGCD